MRSKPSLLWRFRWTMMIGVLFVVSVPLQVLLVISQVKHSPSHTFVTPGQVTFTLTEAGEYTLWLSSQQFSQGKLQTFPTHMPANLTVSVTRLSDQQLVPMSRGMLKTVTSNSVSRESFASLYISQPGEYQLTATGSNEPRLIYMSRDFVLKTVWTVIGCACTSGSLFIAMIITGIYAMVYRYDEDYGAS